MADDADSRILEWAREEQGVRPVEISKRLGLSRETVHRHLRELVARGVLEVRGRGPAARYFAVGLPDLKAAHLWHSADAPPQTADERHFATPLALESGLEPLARRVAEGLPKSELGDLLAVIAHLAGNSFDHNAGAWHGAPGCWIEAQRAGKRLWLCVADRGQGVLRSLRRAHPEIKDEQDALVAAFDRPISGSGRPGNGLKKVRWIVGNGERGIACRSGRGVVEGLVDYGSLGPACRAELARLRASSFGTFTLVAWKLG